MVNAAQDHRTQFTKSYQGLIISDLIKHVESTPSAAPTYKEVTAIVRSAHKLVESVDESLLRDLDLGPTCVRY